MTLVFGYFSLNDLGIFAWTSSLGGHKGIFFNSKYMKLTQVMIIRDTVDWDKLKRYAISCSVSPARNRTSVKKHSSMGGNDR